MTAISAQRILWVTALLFIASGCFQFSQKDDKSISVQQEIQKSEIKGSEFILKPNYIAENDTIPPLPDSVQANSVNSIQSAILPSVGVDSSKNSKPKGLVAKEDSLKLFPSKRDSLKFGSSKSDTTAKIPVAVKDSLWSSQDSSARLEQFTYKREPQYSINPVPDYKYSLFLSDPKTSKKEVSVDSTLTYVMIREKMGDLDIREPISMKYDDYVKERFQQNIRSNFQDMVTQKSNLKKADAIEELLSKLSNVEIYVPGGGSQLFRTIFGPPKISIRVNGSIDIKLGWANETNSNANSGTNGTGSTNDPLFDQQFQMNVQGTVGDKLDIYADWSTERTFEYENNLRLTYTGYQDEIIQKIEAGNVSIAIPNSRYIAGSTALFGIKTKMQIGPLGWTFLVSQKKGKTETKSISGGSQESDIDIPASEYDNLKHFFLGGVFANNYESTFTDPRIIGSKGYFIGNVEVWRSNIKSSTDQRHVLALTNLGENPQSPNEIFAVEPDPKYNDAEFGVGAIEKLRNGEDLPSPEYKLIPDSEKKDGFFAKLNPTEYTVDQVRGILHLNNALSNGEYLAVSYQYTNSAGQLINIGDQSTLFASGTSSSQKLILKLISNGSSTPSTNKYMWELMLKNIYNLKASDFEEKDISLDIKYEKDLQLQQNPGDFKENLIKVLKLDRLDASDNVQSDNIFDYKLGITIDPRRGELTFPSRKPFVTLISEGLINQTEDLKNKYVYSELYDTTQNGAKNGVTGQAKNKYKITGKVKGAISDRYQLGFNITEGSVKVTANGGIQLTEGVDYIVDYQIGSIQIKNREYLRAGSGLAISYESNELFSLASKTFIGSRFDYDISEKAKLGFTWMRYAEKPLTDKVRVGDEAQQNNIWGFDGSYDTPSRFLTKLTNWIPGIETDAESNFSIRGEYAQFLPGHPSELNTKLDPGGVAYIDDFEGSKRSVPIGFGSSWSLSSAPDNLPFLSQSLNPEQKTEYRADIKYYVNPVLKVPVKEIWPERSVSSKDNTISVFSVSFDPKIRGQFNYSLDLENKIYNSNGETWGGIQKAMPSYITNLVDENIEFIEFWFQISDNINTYSYTRHSGEMYIDLGAISEDILPNGFLNTERALSAGTEADIRDTPGTVHPKYPNIKSFTSSTEDLGMDGLSNANEKIELKTFLDAVTASGIPDDEKTKIQNDPSGDNFSYSNGTYDFSSYNGSEGNTQSSTGTGNAERYVEDTEDMNGSGSLDKNNSYFRYKINLSADSLSDDVIKAGKNFLVSRSPDNLKKWYQVRIPLSEWKQKVGDIKDLSYTEYIRVFMTGFTSPVYLQFATFDFVGNQWLKSEKDSVLSVSVINVEENSTIYNSPPDVVRETDRTRPDENIQLNEQSLLINVEGLKDGEERSVYKNMISGTGGNLDISNYKNLKMFAHIENGKSDQFTNDLIFTDTTFYSAEVFIRFGTDRANYYEISQPVNPDDAKGIGQATWKSNNQFDIDLTALAAFKSLKQGTAEIPPIYNPPGYPIGTKIILKGSPSLTAIKIFTAGVRNPKGKGVIDAIALSAWFNELRVSGFKEESGWAAQVSSSIKLADFASISYNVEQKTAEFRAVTEKPSLGKATSTTWGVSTSASLDKLISNNNDWSIPFAYSHSEQITQPKYQSGSDILLTEAAKNTGLGDKLIDLNRTVSVTNSVGFNNIRKVSQSKNPFLIYTIDKLSFDYSYSISRSRSPQTEWSNSWQWAYSTAYKYSFSRDLFVKPFQYPMELFKFDFLWLNKIFEEKTVTDWQNTKLYLKPDGFNWDVKFNRSRSQNKQRNALKEADATTTFTSSRSFGLQYTITDNLSFTGTGAFQSNLDGLLRIKQDSVLVEQNSSAVYSKFFKQLALLNFGVDRTYNQATGLTYKIPFFAWANLTSSYSAQYSWNNSQPDGNFGKSVGWGNSLSLGSTIKIPEIVGDLFKKNIIDSKQKDTLSIKTRMLSDLSSIANSITALENISIRYTLTKSYQTNGVDGGPGAFNFFPFNSFGNNENLGPGIAFQLGLSTDPGKRISFSQNKALIVNERFSETNALDFKTAFHPSQTVNVDLSWKLSWNSSKENTGTLGGLNTKEGGGFSRSFVSIFGDFKSIQKALPTDPATGNYDFGNNSVVSGFRDGLELLKLSSRTKSLLTIKGLTNFSSDFQDLFPLPNWSVSWSGLEKFPLWSKVITTASLSHIYTGDYTSTYTIRPDAGVKYKNTFGQSGDSLTIPYKEFSSPRMSERFSPLIGLNMNWKGGFTTRLNLNTSKNISLSTVNFQVTTNKSTEYSATLSYLLSGNTLKLPAFISSTGTLKSDLDFSLSASYATDETVIENLSSVSSVPIPPTGQTRLSLEPRASYSISSRVNATGFFKYTKTKPLADTKTTPEISRWEAGVNIHITIQ